MAKHRSIPGSLAGRAQLLDLWLNRQLDVSEETVRGCLALVRTRLLTIEAIADQVWPSNPHSGAPPWDPEEAPSPDPSTGRSGAGLPE